MDVDQREVKGVLVLNLSGDVSIITVEGLKGFFKAAVDSGTQKVLLNMDKVSYIDSLGLATLIGFYRQIENGGGALALSNITPKVASIFRITKVDKAFDIYKSEDEAVKALNGKN